MIYIDFDRTLFDTESFLKDFYKLIQEENIPKEVFNNYKEESDGLFNPYTILNNLKDEYNFSDNLFLEIDRLIERDMVYLYEDGLRFLNNIKKNKKEISLLTRGDKDYQLYKINNCHINSYFKNIIVTNLYKGDININYNSIFIDDNPDEIKSILKNNPNKVYFLDRKKEYNNLNINNVEVIHSLDEIDIKNL